MGYPILIPYLTLRGEVKTFTHIHTYTPKARDSQIAKIERDNSEHSKFNKAQSLRIYEGVPPKSESTWVLIYWS